jgi:hypothetical protein
MNTYPKDSYPNLYEEILKDYHYRFPKYNPIDYPNIANPSKPILKERPLFPPTK